MKKTLSWERVAGRSPDGGGARSRTKFVPPLIRRCGGTFPQGKVRRIRKENKTMIHATFTQDAQKGSVTMEMQGHALTAPKGEDLICAAATMLVYTLGQAVQFLYEQGRLLYEPQMRMVDGYAKITVYPRKCAMAETLMAFWVAQAGAYVLERNYPKAVDLMPMEVSA